MIEHKTVSLADQVFEHLETDILSGKYQRGEILTESKLSAELGVSRTPIREALRRLEQEHLIEEAPKGSVVVGISEKDLGDIFMIRMKLEGQAAAMAAQNRTDEQLESLREAVEFQEFYLEKHDADRIKSMDSRFHEMVFKMSGSAVFYDVLLPLHKKILKYRRASVSNTSRAEASVAEHRAIYEAIAASNSVLAEKLIIEHLDNAYMHMKG
ncbi:MAG: GntR family transcriptional regulator [Clostridia bacterium]|nr:GntR family transcriptional regulator [Clostridia bacterium]MBQ2316422.1 GntR family transcriptional regulator [Clostridia bacterium]MEE0808114.1 GntR family transcriptional regulator [Acutalibacteraceae bacterium]